MIAIIADIVVTVLIVNDPFRDRNLFTFFYIYTCKNRAETSHLDEKC